MPLDTRNLPAHELVGLRVTVTSSTDPFLRGLSGTVYNETRNTLIIEARGRVLTVPKQGASFLFELPSGRNATIDGNALRFRPEDRVKKAMPRW